jgi:hypothetical protein
MSVFFFMWLSTFGKILMNAPPEIRAHISASTQKVVSTAGAPQG